MWPPTVFVEFSDEAAATSAEGAPQPDMISGASEVLAGAQRAAAEFLAAARETDSSGDAESGDAGGAGGSGGGTSGASGRLSLREPAPQPRRRLPQVGSAPVPPLPLHPHPPVFGLPSLQAAASSRTPAGRPDHLLAQQRRRTLAPGGPGPVRTEPGPVAAAHATVDQRMPGSSRAAVASGSNGRPPGTSAERSAQSRSSREPRVPSSGDNGGHGRFSAHTAPQLSSRLRASPAGGAAVRLTPLSASLASLDASVERFLGVLAPEAAAERVNAGRHIDLVPRDAATGEPACDTLLLCEVAALTNLPRINPAVAEHRIFLRVAHYPAAGAAAVVTEPVVSEPLGPFVSCAGRGGADDGLTHAVLFEPPLQISAAHIPGAEFRLLVEADDLPRGRVAFPFLRPAATFEQIPLAREPAPPPHPRPHAQFESRFVGRAAVPIHGTQHRLGSAEVALFLLRRAPPPPKSPSSFGHGRVRAMTRFLRGPAPPPIIRRNHRRKRSFALFCMELPDRLCAS